MTELRTLKDLEEENAHKEMWDNMADFQVKEQKKYLKDTDSRASTNSKEEQIKKSLRGDYK